jgi:sterol 24-C-methyltransferase
MPVEHRQTERVQKYAKRWDKDSANDTDAHKQQRLDEYTEVVNGEHTFLESDLSAGGAKCWLSANKKGNVASCRGSQGSV